MTPSAIGFATAPISWGACEIPDWGEVLPYARVLDEMAAAGYAGTELGPPGYLPTDPDALRRELAARGLALVGAFCPIVAGRSGERAALARARLLAEVGSGVLVLAEAGDARRAAIAGRVPADGSASFGDETWARFCESVNVVARGAKASGVLTVFHPHVGSYVETPHEIERLLGSTDADLVGLCLDTGHVAYGGGDPATLARDHGERVRHVHLKDVRRAVHERAVEAGLDLRGAVGQGVFAPLGKGDLDLAGTLAVLRDGGFGGWVVVEQDIRLGSTPGASPLADARESRRYLRELLGN